MVLYQDKCQRGRADVEVLGLLRQDLEKLNARDGKEIQGEFVAIDAASADLKAGELYLILIDQVEAALGLSIRGQGRANSMYRYGLVHPPAVVGSDYLPISHPEVERPILVSFSCMIAISGS